MSLRKILHVDDDIDIQEIARLALEEIGGFEVVQCNSGPEALAELDTSKPDLILLDVMMPELSGEETLVRMRQRPELADVPVVFMTAKGNQASRDKLINLGAKGVILKPFDPMMLADELKAIYQE